MMSDRMPAVITIGGEVKRSLVDEFCAVLADSGAGLACEGGCAPKGEKDLLALVNERGALVLGGAEVAWGAFDHLERFLQRHGIPFDRHSEAKYERDGEIVKYRPATGIESFTATQDGSVCVTVAEIEDVLKRLDAIAEMPADHGVAEATAVRDDLRGIMAMGIPPVPPLSIVEG
jgi:hypothetical protein